MSLSCDCGMDASIYDHEWVWFAPSDYSTLKTKRARRCCSCSALIRPGETVAAFGRIRAPNSDIEERIKGDEVEIAPWFHCETCADLYFSLSELGFCIDLVNDDMRALTAQYAREYGGKAWDADA